MSINEDEILKQTYRRHFQAVSDQDVGFVDAPPAGLVSERQTEKERADERYALHFVAKTKAPDSEGRKDYEALFAMEPDALRQEIDNRMFVASKPGESSLSRGHLRALAVGDARGITDTWRQDQERIALRVPDQPGNQEASHRESREVPAQEMKGQPPMEKTPTPAHTPETSRPRSALPPRIGIPIRPVSPALAQQTRLQQQIRAADREQARHTDAQTSQRAAVR